MSKIDDFERRIKLLEAAAGGLLEHRVAAIEETLGMAGDSGSFAHNNPLATTTPGGLNLECKRCGNFVAPDAVDRCLQEKCPLK